MKEVIYKNYQLIALLIGFVLYWLFGVVMSYVIMVLVGVFIFWGKATDKVEMYNFDLLIYIIYTMFSLIALFLIKKDTSNVLVIILGLEIICSYIVSDKISM